MKKYYVEQKETGTVMEETYHKDTADRVIELYERDDKRNNCYTPEFYQVVERDIEEDDKDKAQRDAYDLSVIERIESWQG